MRHNTWYDTRHIASGIRRAQYGGLAVVLGVAIGCSMDAPGAPRPSHGLETVYWSLELNHHVMQLAPVAPYDSARLVATPRTASGAEWVPIPGVDASVGATTFTSSDASVQVSSDGLVTVAGTGANATITASRTINGVTHTDKVLVQTPFFMSSPLQMLKTVRAKGDPGPFAFDALYDSTKRSIDKFGVYWSPQALDQDDFPMFVPFEVTSSDSFVVVASGTYLGFQKPGRTLITVSTWVYGVAQRDTFTFTVGYPLNGEFAVARMAQKGGGTIVGFVGTRREIGPGGVIKWINASGAPFDVVFDDPTQVLEVLPNENAFPPVEPTGGGNMIGVPSDTTQAGGFENTNKRYRRFLAPGEYRFTIRPSGTIGTVVVKSF